MSEYFIKFPQPVSRETLGRLVTEYFKYILYSRGQFPLPLDQLVSKLVIKHAEEAEASRLEDYMIYSDNPNLQCSRSGIIQKTNITVERKKKLYEETIQKFDKFFKELSIILENQDVLEVVMNLGPNMMSPKEFHRITFPACCSHPKCSQNPAPFHKCRLLFFKKILQGDPLRSMDSDNILPISVLLLLKTGDVLTEHMEHKRFYAFPQRCRKITVHFNNFCEEHTTHLADLQDHSLTNSEESTGIQNEGLWVKLKPDLKGFKEGKVV
ncbi:uncharacterized protein TNIN_422021 [Trichonephila inaurata madagascariensis]|uniref:Uncharacterized protein n=1 Tax=Trichonephila inaurata madagascariensis TaxID=2747483 RepID=A0A8X6YWI3_9ARAC|nr:uncharacterized protein TNIN_422021 [Trichonephila inaurata madagascariensis]